ncbi:MAG: hypothetical protein CMP22_06890 [Rickettsiales bacterium]|nr:hypothetical protein [Rickettsiales bacterium]|tara:strand:+ start:542 stop:1192 length:651 start_codon:yes stop_codon:yes gene_type:complete
MRQYLFLTALIFGIGIASPSDARPVSYPDAWTTMISNNGDMNSVHIHYTPTINYSIGLRAEYRRDEQYGLTTIQLNNLLKRWNMPDAQANFYLKSGAGFAYSDYADYDQKTDLAGFTGIALDWENRRYFTSYENRYIHAGEIARGYTQTARVGVAPYIGDYGDLHTWLMLEVEHKPTDPDDQYTVTPLVRLFKDVHLVEAGISNHGDVLFNWVMRY